MRAINPPGPRFTIPKSTLVTVSPDLHPERRREHRTRQRLAFDYAHAYGGPELRVFRYEGYLIYAQRRRIFERPCRVVFALKFALVGNCDLCVWPDKFGNSPYAIPVDKAQTLLDVEAGDKIRHGASIETVVEVSIYRSSPVVNPGPIRNGRAFLEG